MANDAKPVRVYLCSPELRVEQFDDMLAELDAICRQARELSTQITLQIAAQQQEKPLVEPDDRCPAVAGTPRERSSYRSARSAPTVRASPFVTLLFLLDC